MNNQFLKRIIIDLVLLLVVFHGWWFVALPIALLATWNFPYFFEIVLAGIAYDSLFGFVPELGIFGYAGIIVSVAIVILSVFFKRVVRVLPHNL